MMAFLSVLLGGFIIIDYDTHSFLDIFDNLDFGISGEWITTLVEQLLKIVCNISSSKMDSLYSMGDCIALIDWHSVGNTISRVKNDTGGSTI